MRKLCLLLLLCLVLIVPAWAEEADPAAAWFEAEAAELNPLGLETREQRTAYTLTLPEGEALSLCLTVEGNLRFGRYAQLTRTALLDAGTGEELTLDKVFGDPDELRSFLDEYVETQVLDELNTYLDANDLLPVPLDAVSLDEQGVTFHYPAERFQYFSGHAGAVQLQWYELRELLAFDAPEQPFPLAAEGQIDELLTQYGSLTDPDLVAGGEIYEFESPALRGVQVIADDGGAVQAVRARRFCVQGVTPGMSREETRQILGEPEEEATVDADTARDLRLREGARARYGHLTLYFDQADSLWMMEAARQ